MVGNATIWTELRFRNLATAGLREAAQEFRRTSSEIQQSGQEASKSFSGMSTAANLLSGALAGVVVGAIFNLVNALTETNQALEESEKNIRELAIAYEAAGQTIIQTNQNINQTAKGGFLSFIMGENIGKLSDDQLKILTNSLGAMFKAIEGARVDKFSDFALAFQTLGITTEEEGRIRKTSDLVFELLNKIRDRGIFTAPGGTGAIEKVLGSNAPEFIKEVERDFLPLYNALTKISENEPRLPAGFQFFDEIFRQGKDARQKSKQDWKDWSDAILDEFKETERRAKEIQKLQLDAEKKQSQDRLAVIKATEKSIEELEKITRQSRLDSLSPLERENFLLNERERRVEELLNVTGVTADEQERLRNAAGQAFNEIQKQRGLANSKPDENVEKARTAMKILEDGFKELQEIGVNEVGQGLNQLLINLETHAGNLRDTFLQIGQQLAQVIQQQLILTAVKAGFTALGIAAAGGAVFQGGFQAFASGSPNVDRPTLGLVGEGRTAEAVIPLPDNRNVPVKVYGNSGGEVHLTIHANDAQSFEDLLARPGSRRRIREEIRAMTASDMPYRRTIRGI